MVEHPLQHSAFSVISKADDKRARNAAIAGAIPVVGSAGPAVLGSVYARKGKKLKTAVNAGVRSTAEGTGGAFLGAGAAAALRGRGLKTLSTAGMLAGSSHGGYASIKNSKKKGYLK